MGQSRRDILQTALGLSAAAGIAEAAGKQAKTKKPLKEAVGLPACSSSNANFYVISHGMMVFRLVPPTTKSPGKMILSLPFVPAMGSQPGHIYRAGSANNDASTIDLAPTDADWETARYTLTGISGGNGISAMDGQSDVWLTHDCGCEMGGTGCDKPYVEITLPLPMCYTGWRKISSKDQFPLLISNNDHPPQEYLPETIFLTHVFGYSFSPQTPPQLNRVDAWGNPTPTDLPRINGGKFHVFAELVPSSTASMDHGPYLHALFWPHLEIKVVCDYQKLEADPGTVVPGFTLADLLDWQEVPKGNEKLLAAAQPTNCRSYGFGS